MTQSGEAISVSPPLKPLRSSVTSAPKSSSPELAQKTLDVAKSDLKKTPDKPKEPKSDNSAHSQDILGSAADKKDSPEKVKVNGFDTKAKKFIPGRIVSEDDNTDNTEDENGNSPKAPTRKIKKKTVEIGTQTEPIGSGSCVCCCTCRK